MEAESSRAAFLVDKHGVQQEALAILIAEQIA